MATNNAEHYVNGIFSRALNDLSKSLGTRNNTKNSIIYDTQVEFCYMVKAISGGPDYIAPKFVAKIEGLVEKIHDFIGSAPATLPEEFVFPITGKTYSWDGSTYRRK
jgi:hypothetical protein